MPRLFFALVPDATARDLLARLAAEMARGSAGGRATRAENLHLTVAFLGAVPVARIDAVRTAGARVAARSAGFTLALERLGRFRSAGIAWVAPALVPPPLQHLFDALKDALRSQGLPLEARAFHPHVTLARRCARLAATSNLPPITWRVEALVLMSSQTLPEGPRYSALVTWPLGADGDSPRRAAPRPEAI